ncbi:unnamed protein product, partial [Adineta steineri]
SDTNFPIINCLSPSSSLASRFSQSVAFSPTSSSLDDLNSRLSHHTLLSNQNPDRTTVPLISSLPTSNLIFSISQTPNHYEYFNPKQERHDQQPIVQPTNTNTSSTTTTTTHVLCR